MAELEEVTGLGNVPRSEWKKPTKKSAELTPMQRLANPEIHASVLAYLLERIIYSENEMQKHKSRWRVSEKKHQAYITLKDWEQALQDLNDKGEPPKAVSLVVPYTFATISTIVTYLIHTFAGRKPMFQIGSNKQETAMSSRNMELKLQYDADHTRLIKHLAQFLFDGQIYGVSILRCQWAKETKVRTRFQKRKILGVELPQETKVREDAIVYEGNEVASIDPYMFYPDPRVPMTEVNKTGEFAFWKSYEGLHTLKIQEKAGIVFNINKIPAQARDAVAAINIESDRDLRSGGEDQSGRLHDSPTSGVKAFIEVFQGSVVIIPAELGLGESIYPEKWLFAIGNRGRIIQARPLELDHDMHPVVVSEPYTTGYGFGQLGISDYLNPVQDMMSWLVNSHIDNVRTALNNMFVFDPSRIELQDLKNPGAGKLIRVKKTAYGQPVNEAIHQFPVQDVTQGHIRDFSMFMKMGDTMSAVTDNLRGQQDSGSRKTATEVRTSGEAAASRLAAIARLVSAQAITDLTEQMSLNNQQNLSEEFFIEVVGQDGIENPIRIAPNMLTGDFHYPVHDGTLPLDRVALLDVWKDILLGVIGDQQLRSEFDVKELFKFVGELGGAKNLERFEITAQPDAQVAQQAQAGNLVPAKNITGGETPGVNANQGQRIIQ